MQQRDAETGNDPTLFRMYESRLYRWLSPDPVAGDAYNPQSLKRYAYVLNNPVRFNDPLGLRKCMPGGPCPEPHHRHTGPPSLFFTGMWQVIHMGNDIFDAIGGAEGTWLDVDMYGNLNWGVDRPSPFMWHFYGTFHSEIGDKTYDETFATWDEYASWRTGIFALPQNQRGYLNALLDHLSYVVEGLREQGATLTEIRNFVNYNLRRIDQIGLEGGNFHFFDTGFSFSCPHGRCDNGLDFSHGKDALHRDTANPYVDVSSAVVHLVVDVIGGTFVYWIPRH
jgi:RHS repeat-associated protein